MFVKLVHPQKVPLLMIDILFERVISVKPEQALNAYIPILVTLFGTDIPVISLQQLNAEPAIAVVPAFIEYLPDTDSSSALIRQLPIYNTPSDQLLLLS